MLSISPFNFILFIICSLLLGVGASLQLLQNALPCSLCVMQRLALMALAASFLLCALQKPKHQGLWIYTVFNAVLVAIGLGASGRQIWLQNNAPPHSMCVPTLPSALNDPFIIETLNNLGTHQCAEAGPSILGLNLSFWTFLFFSLLGAMVLLMPLLFGRRIMRAGVSSPSSREFEK